MIEKSWQSYVAYGLFETKDILLAVRVVYICIMIDAFLFFCIADVDTAAATIARTDGTRLLTLSLLNEKVIVKY